MEKDNHVIFRCKLYTVPREVKRARLMLHLSLTKPFWGITYTKDVAVKFY